MAQDKENQKTNETRVKENVRITGNLPKDLYDRLYEGDRWEQRLEKGEYMTHVFAEYERLKP